MNIHFLVSDLLVNNHRIMVVLPGEQVGRLATTCFRGGRNRLAGNTRWDNFGQMMRDQDLFLAFAAMCRTCALEAVDDKFEESFEVDHPKLFVGWDSTARRERIPEASLEEFKPSKRSRALRISRNCSILAPLTKTLTFVCSFQHRILEHEWNVIIRSIYPGRDVGQLLGDVSLREGRVFFDWDHPGEPLP